MDEQHTVSTTTTGQTEGGHHEESLSSLTLPALNFAVFLGILAVIYKKKVAPALKARVEGYKVTAARVAAAEERYEREVESLRYQLAKIEEEDAEVVSRFRNEGVRSAEALTKQGLDEISQLQAETAQTKVNLVNQLESDVRTVIAEKAMQRAMEKLTQTLTPEMDRNLRMKALEAFKE